MREKYGIMADILEHSKNGSTRQNLILTVKTSHFQVRKYCGTLIKSGLLCCSEEIYSTTRLGLQYLKAYRRVDSVLNMGKQVKPENP